MRPPSAFALLVLAVAAAGAPGIATGQNPQCATPAYGQPAYGQPSCTQPIPRQPCQPDCPPTCPPPCPPSGPPRRGQPREGQPREAVGPAGNYVAPPPSGTIEGPQRGYEVGTMAITFPELTLSLPRLRFGGCSHFLRGSRMHLDSNVAPYVENPYAAYQAGLVQEQPTTERDAQEREAEQRDGKPREATGPNCTQATAPPVGRGSDADLHSRLDRLERSLEEQLDAMNRCMRELKQIQQQSPHQSPHQSPIVEPLPVPQPSPYFGGQHFPHQRVPPGSPSAYSVGPASYLQPVPQTDPAVRRLPPISDE